MSLFAFSSENILSLSPVTYNARRAPFRIHGLYKPEEEGAFRRMPTEIAEATNSGVKLLHKNTAGAPRYSLYPSFSPQSFGRRGAGA